MKFNLMGYDQEKLYSKYSNLNCNDIVVLRRITDMIANMDVKIKQDNKEYSWIRYKLLVEDLPFITQSESTMKKIVQKLIDAGLIERLVINRGGKYTYFRKTEKCRELEYKKELANEIESPVEVDEVNQYKINKVNKILSENIKKKTILTVIETNSLILQKAIILCEEKQFVTNSYFLNAIKIASSYQQQQSDYNKNQLGFNNFEPREYDYDELEQKLLGWAEY